MEIEIGRGKKARRAYGFDDIAIVPSRRTRDPDDVDISWKLGPYRFELPLLASAMDGVVSPRTAITIGKLGGLARPQPRGHLHAATRTPTSSSSGSPALPKDLATREMQEIYQRADQARADARSGSREIKASGVVAAASLTPQRVARVLRDRARRGPRHPRHPGHGRLGRARLEDEPSR